MESFKLRVKTNDFEIEVESPDQGYTDGKFAELLRLVGGSREAARPAPARAKASSPQGPAVIDQADQSIDKPTSMVEYVRTLSPKSGSQYVVAIGAYLESHGGMESGFRSRDISGGFKSVKYKHANPAEAIRQAKSQGFLMDGREPGTMIVTQTGEAWVKGQLATE